MAAVGEAVLISEPARAALADAASAMAPSLAAMESAWNVQANAMVPSLAAMTAALNAQMAPALAAMESAWNVQMLGEALDRPVPVLRMTITEKQHHNSAGSDAEIRRLRRRVRLLESQVRGHWLDDTDDYDWEDDSLPWSTDEG